MTEFTIKLAEISIGVKALFSETKSFCRDYLTNECPAFEVELTSEDILSERRHNERQIALEGFSQADYTDEYLETLALYRKITALLVDYGVLLFHGAVMAAEGKAYLFTAKSGTGKTTHCRLWLDNIPNCHILNGDKPLLLFKENTVYACGTPWMGKENFGTNEILPLAGLCILERSETNHIERIPFAEAYPILLMQTHISDGTNKLLKTIRILKNLEAIALYRLGCNMDTEAAFVSYHAMAKNEYQI